MRIDGHIAEALSRPVLLRGADDRYLLRFESMKVASARAALRAALDAGRVRPGGTVIDSSSGIYAYALALALACDEAGVRCRIVGSTTIDEGLRVQLLALGVDLEQMPPSASLKLDQDRRVRRITELLAQDPSLHWMRQYHDPVHYLGYRDIARGVAAELAAEGVASVRLVAPVGSGCPVAHCGSASRRRVWRWSWSACSPSAASPSAPSTWRIPPCSSPASARRSRSRTCGTGSTT